MPLSDSQQGKILTLLRTKMDEKIRKYNRETSSMPFMTRLIQDEELVASFSFMISLATTLGMSIFERVAQIIGEENSEESKCSVKIGGMIGPERKLLIAQIVNDLRQGRRIPNKKQESQEILNVSNANAVYQKEGNVADFYMKKNGAEYYFEIKTVKPNIDVFTASKRKMLEWVAIKDKMIYSMVALPYNPYAPEPYQRFTEQNLLDRNEELKVGNEFWNLLGGEGTYEQLLDIFDRVGKEYKSSLKTLLQKAGRRVSAT